MAEPVIYIVDHRQYHVVWRKTLEEYADMQERQLLKVIELMRNYPQYKFTISQAITLANFLVRHYDLESELAVRLTEGQLGVTGGAYAIPDTNMVSGEALYRNLLNGLRFFRSHFEYKVRATTLAGASGYSAQLPQILRQLGLECVAGGAMPALRLEPLDGQPPPASAPRSFEWEGLDGTGVPVHLPTIEAGPTRFYPEPFQEIFRTKESIDLLQIYKDVFTQAQRSPEEAVWLHIWDEERKVDEELVDAMWELRRKKLPKQMKLATPVDYLDRIAGQPVTCVHHGEMNPVNTGTYSTRIALKQGSVLLENLAAEVEKWFCAAGTERLHYPELKFQDIWEQIFVLQSHHAITGCHTDRVKHRLDSLIHHTQRDLRELRTRAVSAICAYINAPRRGDWRPLHVFNSLNWRRSGIVQVHRLGGVQIADSDGNPVPVLNRGDTCHFIADVPACGYTTYWFLAGGGQAPHEAPQREFETDCFRVAVGSDLNVAITDKRTGTLITRSGEQWGTIAAREDRGSLWCKGYTGKYAQSVIESARLWRALLGWELQRTGSIRQAAWHEFGTATWTQSLFFYDTQPCFDMHLDVHWRGSATELRLRLPFGPFAHSSVYGIPFGSLARFPYKSDAVLKDGRSVVEGQEWPACAWAEIGDGEYGVTVAHTGTPGFRCEGGAIEVSLLRSPIDDPAWSHNFYLKAERGAHEHGKHHYRFSFSPGAGDWRANRSYRFGCETHNPLFAYVGPAREGRSPAERSFLDFGPDNLICSAWTANHQGHQFARIYEAEGTPTELVWGRKPERRVYFASPFQERLEPAERIIFRPFEIRNIMLV